MEHSYKYFKRDVSWLSFNFRVLLEAEDKTLPVYERIKFLSIYSSNLEEFYEIRVAEHRGVIMKRNYVEEDSQEAEQILAAITNEVNNQQNVFYRIFQGQVLPELNKHGVFLYQDHIPKPFHKEVVKRYFEEEIFPFLSPVMLEPEAIRIFLRDRRLYLIVRLTKKGSASGKYYYALIKIPFAKVPRFIELPKHEATHYIMFIDDVIRANLSSVFPGYNVESCYSIKISRDADIYFEDENGNLVEKLKKKVKKRKIGALSRFMYDAAMPDDFLTFIRHTFGIDEDSLVRGGRYLNLQDLIKLPNPLGKAFELCRPEPINFALFEKADSVFKVIRQQDVLLHFPYYSFDYMLRFLTEAATDPNVAEIKVTQYRVAEDSAVINILIRAANIGKKVTVFVELKARFDEENNIHTAERMKQAGIRIIYSIPGLKVHAKVAVVLLKKPVESGYAYLSTGNFNEKTATVYSDMALLTSNQKIIHDIKDVFAVLEGRLENPRFDTLLVARFNMVDELTRMIRRESEHVRQGKKGRIILKMNGLHDQNMIMELYQASEAGVEIDLIVRGICCLVPNQPYSRNIRITRIVDMYLEHSRVWYFYNNGEENLYMTSADWMRRNLSRRIETAFPILSPEIKQEIIDILNIQLQDNVKACFIDENLANNFKHDNNPQKIRAQEAIYTYLSSSTKKAAEK